MPTTTYLIPVYRAKKARGQKKPGEILGRGKPVGMPESRAQKLMFDHPLDWEFSHDEEEALPSGKLNPWEEVEGGPPVRRVDVMPKRNWTGEAKDPKDAFVVDGGPGEQPAEEEQPTAPGKGKK